MKRKPFFN